MSKELEEIKEILLKYNPTIKETLDAGLVESKSAYMLEEFLNEIINKEVTDIDIMDLVLIVDQLREHDKIYYRNLRRDN